MPIRPAIPALRLLAGAAGVTSPTSSPVPAAGALDNTLASWSEPVRKVARELQVPLLDLNARSARAVQALGPNGAELFAAMIAGSLATAVPEIAGLLES